MPVAMEKSHSATNRRTLNMLIAVVRSFPWRSWLARLLAVLSIVATIVGVQPRFVSANPLLPAEFRRGNSQEFYFQSNRPLVPPIQHIPPNHNVMPLELELELRRQMDSLAALCRSLSENANVYIENQSPFRRTVPCKTVLMRHFLETNRRPITLPPRPIGTVNIRTHTIPPMQHSPTSAPVTPSDRPKRVQYVNVFRPTTSTSSPQIYPTPRQPLPPAPSPNDSYESDDVEPSEATPTSPIPPRVLKSNTNVEKLKIALRNYHLRMSTTMSTPTTDSAADETASREEATGVDHSVSGSAPRHTHIITFKRDDLRTLANHNRTTLFERRPLNEPKKFKLTTAHVAYILIGSCCGASVFSLIIVAATMRSKKHDHRFPHRYTLKKCPANPGRAGKGPGGGKPGCLCEMWSFGDAKFGEAKSLYFRRLPFGTASTLSAGGSTAAAGQATQPQVAAPAEGEESIHCTCLVHVNSRGDASRHNLHKAHSAAGNGLAANQQLRESDEDPALAAVFLSTNRDCLV